MSPSKKPYILLDFNLLLWMPDIDLSILKIKEPKKFDRAEEQAAFLELLKMRTSIEIEISMSNELPTGILGAFKKYPEIKNKVESFFRNKMLLSEFVVFSGSETEEKVDRGIELLVDGGEKSDDPAIFILANYVTPGVTHLATCDIGFIRKAESYRKGLTKDDRLNKYINFLRMNKDLMIDIPSKILEDLRK
jgi:hypothetical protein